MHELGIVFHIIDSLEKIAVENQLSEIASVTLEIGEVSGVVDSYLKDCWKWAAGKHDFLKGAELILCPSAFPIRDKDMWDTYFGTRSLENGCFVGGLNRVGLESDDKTGEMFGDNKIYNPRGKLVAEAPLNEEALLVATLDLEDVGRYRENEVVYLRDRRPETYELLSKLY